MSALWTVAEVAEWAKVDPSTLRRWARAHQVAHTRVGTRYRFTDEQRNAVAVAVEAKTADQPTTSWGVSPRSRLRATA